MPEGYVAYVGRQCLGVDGGLMGVGKQDGVRRR